jgi:hypothetical protein
MPGDSPLPYVTAGSPGLTYEELCRRAAIIEERETREKREKPKKNPYPTAGGGEQGRPRYFHPRYSASNLPSSRGGTTVTQPQRYPSPTLPSQLTPRPDSHDPRMDKRREYDRDWVPSGQLVRRRSRRSQEGKRSSEGGTSVQGSISSRLPSNKPPSKDDQFGDRREYFQPPPLPYTSRTQFGPPTEGEWPELVDVG